MSSTEIANSQQFLSDLRQSELLAISVKNKLATAIGGSDTIGSINNFLHDAGYLSTIDEIVKQYYTALPKDIAFWGGRYNLVANTSSRVHVLDINEYQVTLDGLPVHEYTFNDFTIRWKKCAKNLTSGKLVFRSPGIPTVNASDQRTVPVAVAEAGRDADFLSKKRNEYIGITVHGEITSSDGEGRTVNGKLGVYSLRALRTAGGVDELGYWAGKYRVSFKSDSGWSTSSTDLSIQTDGKTVAVFYLGRVTETSFTDQNLRWRAEDDNGNMINHSIADVSFYQDLQGNKFFEGSLNSADSPQPPRDTSLNVLGELYEITATTGLEILTKVLPNGESGQPYHASLEAGGGKGTYTWSTTTSDLNALPENYTLNPTGDIDGVTTASGVFRIDATVTDSINNRASGHISLTVRSSGEKQGENPVAAQIRGWAGVIFSSIVAVILFVKKSHDDKKKDKAEKDKEADIEKMRNSLRTLEKLINENPFFKDAQEHLGERVGNEPLRTVVAAQVDKKGKGEESDTNDNDKKQAALRKLEEEIKKAQDAARDVQKMKDILDEAERDLAEAEAESDIENRSADEIKKLDAEVKDHTKKLEQLEKRARETGKKAEEAKEEFEKEPRI